MKKSVVVTNGETQLGAKFDVSGFAGNKNLEDLYLRWAQSVLIALSGLFESTSNQLLTPMYFDMWATAMEDLRDDFVALNQRVKAGEDPNEIFEAFKRSKEETISNLWHEAIDNLKF